MRPWVSVLASIPSSCARGSRNWRLEKPAGNNSNKMKGPASLDRQACKREAGNLHQTLDFNVNFEFQGLEMLLAVAATEEP